MQCYAHISNLIVKNGLEIISKTIKKIHQGVTFKVLHLKEIESLKKQSFNLNLKFLAQKTWF